MPADSLGLRAKNFLRLGRRRLHELLGDDIVMRNAVRLPSVHLGSVYGGWRIVAKLVPSRPRVFSIGIGQDISFDLEMIRRFDAEVYGFDPTPKSMRWIEKQSLPANFHFISVGLADYDGVADFGLDRPDWDSYSVLLPAANSVERVQCRVARLATLAALVNVKKIDILKIDIEGSEYAALPDVMQSGFTFPQLLLELHYQNANKSELERARNLLEQLNSSGYQLFRRSEVGREFSFVHESAL